MKYVVSIMTFVLPLLTAHNLKFISDDRLITSLQVHLPHGSIQGNERFTVDQNKSYLAFQGIPYAKPPIGVLRFKPPVSIPQWEGVLDCTSERSPCVQLNGRFGSEDCLYLNVYTPISTINDHKPTERYSLRDWAAKALTTPAMIHLPLNHLSKNQSLKISSRDKLPVMVFIYGGAFANGFSNSSVYGPDFLLDQGVVFVSLNYRVGVFGFLSTEDLESPGNYGFKDIIEALHWVQDNVIYFGGDPDKVTIFGQSAGAASVGYLIGSERAKGLFQAAIMQSGSALCPWSLNRNSRYIAHMIALGFGLFNHNSTTIMEKLRRVDAQRLNRIARAVAIKYAFETTDGLAFSPSLEPEHDAAVVTGRMHERLNTGSFSLVPIIMGFTSQEASVIQDYVNFGRPYIARWDLHPGLLVPENLRVRSTDKKSVAQMIKTFYFGNRLIAACPSVDILGYIGDSQFVRSIRENARVCSSYVPVYLYQFSYEGLLGRYGLPFHSRNRSVDGAGHVEDLWYIFHKANLTSPDMTDYLVRRRMVRLWTNFAKYWNPTPDGDQVLEMEAEDEDEDAVAGKDDGVVDGTARGEDSFSSSFAGSPKLLQGLKWPTVNEQRAAAAAADRNREAAAGGRELAYLNIDARMEVRKNPRADTMALWDYLYGTYGHPPFDNY